MADSDVDWTSLRLPDPPTAAELGRVLARATGDRDCPVLDCVGPPAEAAVRLITGLGSRACGAALVRTGCSAPDELVVVADRGLLWEVLVPAISAGVLR